MKTKINLKKGILFLVTISMLIGCDINIIPVVVNKKIEAKVELKLLQDKTLYYQAVDVDLSLATDDVDKIATAVIKSFELTLNDDYVNAATNNEINAWFVAAFVVGQPDRNSNGDLVDSQEDALIINTASFQQGGISNFKVGVPNKYTLVSPVTLKNYIKDNKVKLLIGYRSLSAVKFGDSDFSLRLKVETELQVDL